MPKKKGVVAGSPAANKRQAASAKRAAARKRQDAEATAAEEPAEATATTTAVGGGAAAAYVGAAAAAGVDGSPGKEDVNGSVARGEAAAVVSAKDAEGGFDDATPSRPAERDVHAGAEVVREEAADAVAADCGDAAAVMAVDTVASKGDPGGSPRKEEVNGSVAREAAAVVAVKMEVEEELNEAETVALPVEGQDAHAVAEVDRAEEAVATAMVDGANASAEIVEDAAEKGDVAGLPVEAEEAVLAARQTAASVALKMEAEVEPGAGKVELATASSPSCFVATDALSIASELANLPPSLPPQFRPSSHSISHTVDELKGLSTALSAFTRCWDDLSHHLDSIHGSMDALARVLDGHHFWTPTMEGKQGQENKMEIGADTKKEAGEGVVEEKNDEDTKGAEKTKKQEQARQPSSFDLKSICEKMSGRNLRRYVVAHLSEVERLREEVPKSLRLAPNPAKLVLSCIGRFYLQGSRAYGDPNAPMVSVRRACILVLEFFLLSGCLFSDSGHLSSSSSDATKCESAPVEALEGKEVSISVKEETKVVAVVNSAQPEAVDAKEASISVKDEAEVAAVAWKNRLMAEGGIASASAVDALGLALFVASFGIPSDFGSEMMYEMFQLCNMKKKAGLLRQSPIIIGKLPDIIQDLVQKEKYIAAADLVCGFGLQEKYPPLDLISSFLIKTNTVSKVERREGQCSMRSLKEATSNQLAAYQSVVKCLEDHKLDPSSLASFRIEEKLSKLEKEVERFDKKLKDKNSKRKAEDAELTNEAKAPAKRPASYPAEAASGLIPSQVKPTQDHDRILSLSKHLYDGSSNRFPGLLDGSELGNMAGTFGDGLGATASLFAGSVGYGIHPSAVSSGASYGWYQQGALGDSSVGHSFVGIGHSGQASLMGPSPTENLQQLAVSRFGMGSRTMGSSLYEFADNVMENESYYRHSIRSNALPNSASAYHSSYLN